MDRPDPPSRPRTARAAGTAGLPEPPSDRLTARAHGAATSVGHRWILFVLVAPILALIVANNVGAIMFTNDLERARAASSAART